MKYTLITGASRGIGRACALELAKAGHNLILVAKTDKAGLDETVRLIYENISNKNGYGNFDECSAGKSTKKPACPEISIGCYLCDISNSKCVAELFEKLKKSAVKIDVLINNAGISHFGLFQYMTDEEWHNVIATNLDSVFYMSRAVIGDMLHEHSGHIVNISSYWGIVGSSIESAYSASKGGVNAFSLSLAKELELSGIKVDVLNCEFVDTDMNAQFTLEEKEAAAALMPSGRIIAPSEVAMQVAGLLTR